MKRFVVLLGLMVLPVLGFSPPVGAVGYGACTIIGTITFSPSSGALAAASSGTWAIGPALLDCQGVIGKRARITGRGPLRGSGSFTALPPGEGGCLRQNGTGKVEYEIPTASGRILVKEAETHTLAGVGVIDTSTLHGTFQLPPPYDGDCLTKPLGRSTFVAQVTLVRNPREFPPSLPGV